MEEGVIPYSRLEKIRFTKLREFSVFNEFWEELRKGIDAMDVSSWEEAIDVFYGFAAGKDDAKGKINEIYVL